MLILLGGAAAVLLGRRAGDRLFLALVLLGSAVALVPSLSVIAGPWREPALPGAPPMAAPAPFGLDLLSAWFLVLILTVSAGSAVFGVPYLKGSSPAHGSAAHPGDGRSGRRAGTAHFGLTVLVVAMAGVVTARNVAAFLIAWEVMAVAAYFLVIYEAAEPGVHRSGLIYLILTHASTLALTLLFATWASGNVTASFTDLVGASFLPSLPVGLLLTLALIGFGIKAGMFPVHFWLPGAHAAAPSHVSALLSGVMLKVGIYGLFRVLTLIGPAPAWWGWVVLLAGLLSSVLGVLWALAQHDLKRLLAYHSVENIGIILLGLGLGVLGTAYGHPGLALLGYAGALLHSLNHALFKSLLFLGAGSIVHSTGTRDIDRLGGLARRLPIPAVTFLVASIAIVGLPPLNGFVSEWLIFVGLLRSGLTADALRMASVLTVGLALTGALALACFTKLYGTIFLGTPRDAAIEAHPVRGGAFLAPQVFLAAGCAAIGLFARPIVSVALRVAGLLVYGDAESTAASVLEAASMVSVASATLLLLFILAWGARRLLLAGRSRRQSATWGCAYARPTSRMQYTASSFAAPLLAAFGPLSGVHAERESQRPVGDALHPAGERGAPGRLTPAPTRPIESFHTHATDLIMDGIGRRLWKGIGRIASRFRPLQSGEIRRYLSYVILSLVALLIYLSWRGGR